MEYGAIAGPTVENGVQVLSRGMNQLVSIHSVRDVETNGHV